MKEIIRLKSELIDLLFKFVEAKAITSDNKDELSQRNQSIILILNDLINYSQKSHQESITMFYYQSRDELFQAQETFIELAQNLVQFKAKEHDNMTQIRDLQYQCLKQILCRSELGLEQVGFNQNYDFILEENNETNNQEQRKNWMQQMKVSLNYQFLLYEILSRILIKLNEKAISEQEREFVDLFVAMAYFRIPQFRDKFLECLVQSDDPVIDQWRGTEYQLDEEQTDNPLNRPLIHMFDWQGHFYKYVLQNQQGEENLEFLKDTLNQNDWQQRIQQRGVAVYLILSQWSNFVNKTIISKDRIPWQDLPGYRKLLKGFLVEMKIQRVIEYPEALQIASLSMLNNERLINIYIVLAYNNTKQNIIKF